MRLDSTGASGYWTITPEGLFQEGHSKGRQVGLPQLKVMAATLDPLGLPLVTSTLAGNRADDPLYIPAIQRVRASLKRPGLLYVGDSKMGALETRAFVQAGGDFYLCPLSKVQVPPETLEEYLAALWKEEAALTPVYREQPEGQPELIAVGFERLERLTAVATTHSGLVGLSIAGIHPALAILSNHHKNERTMSTESQ